MTRQLHTYSISRDELHKVFVLLRCSKKVHKDCRSMAGAVLKNTTHVLKTYTTNTDFEGEKFCVVGRALAKTSELEDLENQLSKMKTDDANPIRVEKLEMLVST